MSENLDALRKTYHDSNDSFGPLWAGDKER